MKESDSNSSSFIDDDFKNNGDDNIISTDGNQINNINGDILVDKEGELVAAYNGFTDIVSRLNFLLACKTKFEAKKKTNRNVPEDEIEQYEAIEADFINRYIKNGNEEMARTIFKTLGRLRGINNYESYKEYNRQLKNFASNDPDKDAKAKWNLEQLGLTVDSNALYLFYNNLVYEYKSVVNRDSAKELVSNNIDKSTTMAEFLAMCGLEKNAINRYLEMYEYKAKDKVLDEFKNRDNLINECAGLQFDAWYYNAMMDYYADNKISPDEIMKIEKFCSDRKNYNEESIENYTKGTDKIVSSVKKRKSNDAYLKNDIVDSYKQSFKPEETSSEVYNEKMDKIYDSLSTLEEKLEFIVDLYAVSSSQQKLHGVPGISSLYVDNLRKKFFDQYVAGGNIDNCDKVMKEISRLMVSSVNGLLFENYRLQEQYKYTPQKAGVLMRCTAPYSAYSGVFEIFRNMYYSLANNIDGAFSATSQKLLEKYQIDENLTLGRYSEITGKSIGSLMTGANKANLNRDSKAYELFADMDELNGDIDVRGEDAKIASAVERMKSTFINDYITKKYNQYESETQKYMGLEAHYAVMYPSIEKQLKSDLKLNGIEEWYGGEGKELQNLMEINASRQIINDFNKKYNGKEVSYEQYIRLHTGFGVCSSGASRKSDCLAKAVAANALRKRNAAFSLDSIHSLAELIKERPEFKRIKENDNILEKALVDSAGINDMTNELFGKPYAVPDNSLESYIEKMNRLSKNIMPKTGRSREYKAFYDAVKSIGDMKGRFDLSLKQDRMAAGELIKEYNMNLISTIQVYIKDKEKVRSSEGGKERFSNVLDTLAVFSGIVPKLKETVDNMIGKINRIRDAKLESDKHVKLSDYGVDRAVKAHERRMNKEAVKANVVRLK